MVHFAKQEGYIGTFRRNHSNKSPITVGLPDEGGGILVHIQIRGILEHSHPRMGYIGTFPNIERVGIYWYTPPRMGYIGTEPIYIVLDLVFE